MYRCRRSGYLLKSECLFTDATRRLAVIDRLFGDPDQAGDQVVGDPDQAGDQVVGDPDQAGDQVVGVV